MNHSAHNIPKDKKKSELLYLLNVDEYVFAIIKMYG